MTKSILITGCSSGIGLCSALLLKQRGYRVFATARKAEDTAKLAAQGLESTRLDVNDAASMREALDFILTKTGGTLDALFNNAGYLQTGAVEDLTRDMQRAQFETNVFGPMELARMVLPVMRRQGHGRIIQNSSILGIVTIPYCGAYNASKFALEGFSHTLRQELRGTSIHVSMINPGPITSHLRENAWEQYQHTLKNHQGSAHETAYQNMEKYYFQRKEGSRLSRGPELVVKQLVHALESPRPRVHYYVGYSARLLAVLNQFLPYRALDWMLCKARKEK